MNNTIIRTLLKRTIIVFITVFCSLSLLTAQAAATITGKVIDSSNGEPIVGAGVIIRSISKATTTDVNGQYRLTGVPAGQHTVEFVMMGYERAQAPLAVRGGVNNLNVTLSYSTVNEVVVTAKRVSNTDAALLSKRKKAPVAQDAISAEQIAKSPDSDASDAAKRVTGITIVDGRNVYVRGLGERYSNVTFAGSTLPSPNPDKRVVPLDIFPTNLLDNLVITKAYTPDMSGEFGGGNVQINPKDFPDKESFSVSIGTGYHEGTTFKNFNTYKGGKRDFFGYDDGSRAIPSAIKDADIDSADYSAKQREKISEEFSRVYTPESKKAVLPLSIGINYGNTYKIGNETNIGFIASGMFKESSKNKTTEIKRYSNQGIVQKDLEVRDSTYSTISGGLFSGGFTNSSQKLRFTTFFTHQSDDKTSLHQGYNGDRQESGEGDSEKMYKLAYIEESLWFNQLAGDNYIYNKIKAEWTASYALASRYEPDTRTARLIAYGASKKYTVLRAEDVQHYYQKNDDSVIDLNPAIVFPFKQWNGLDSKLKIGGGYMYRERESRARSFSWGGKPTSGVWYDPINDDFTNSSIGADGYLVSESSSQTDKYTGRLRVSSGFFQLDMPLVSQLRLAGGVRYENADMDMITWNGTLNKYADLKREPLEEHNILPGGGITYSPVEDINLRLAFSKTLARPDFREVSEYKYQSMLSSDEIKGNPDLKQTEIYNYDFRFEWFPTPSEIAALSLFYKHMEKPIEMLVIESTPGTTLSQPKNANSADNLGVELEVRKGLGFITPVLSDFSVGSNFAYIFSKINVKDTDDAHYTVKDRPLQGQSPYIINASLNYDNEKSGSSVALLYNIYGRRIVQVGVISGYGTGSEVENEDVYEEPVGKLDLACKQNLPGGFDLKFTASNLLDPEITQTQVREDADTGKKKSYTLSKSRDGRSYSLSAGYKF